MTDADRLAAENRERVPYREHLRARWAALGHAPRVRVRSVRAIHNGVI